MWGGWFVTGVLGGGGAVHYWYVCQSRCYFVGHLLYVCVGGVCMSKEIIGGEEIFDFLLVRAVVGDDCRFVFVSMYKSSVVLTSLVM